MITQEIHFKIDTPSGQLASIITKPPQARSLPAIVFLPGSGGTKERFQNIQYNFSDHGYFTLAFDFRGRGESSGESGQNTLRDQQFDVKHIFSFLTHRQPIDPNDITLFGTSMGAFIAATVCDELPVKHLILSAPALYMPDYELLPQVDLNGKAKEIILQNQANYTQSSAFAHIPRFNNNALILEHGHDEIIPPWLCNAYLEHFNNASSKALITLKGVDHSILTNKIHKQTLSKTLYNWLSSFN